MIDDHVIPNDPQQSKHRWGVMKPGSQLLFQSIPKKLDSVAVRVRKRGGGWWIWHIARTTLVQTLQFASRHNPR